MPWPRVVGSRRAGRAPAVDPEDPPFEDRLAREGADRLSTEQLIAGVLGPRRHEARALVSAARLLEAFETLPRLLTATPRDLAARGRIPPAAAARLAAAFALGRRAAGRPPVRRSLFRTPRDIFERYHPVLREARRERFFCVLLDGKNRVLRDEAVSEGTMTQALVHPREVFGVALRESAAALVLVHNHPSGDPEPSDEDVAITRRLCAVGELVGIRVLDHVVIGDDAFVSFLDRGLLPL